MTTEPQDAVQRRLSDLRAAREREDGTWRSIAVGGGSGEREGTVPGRHEHGTASDAPEVADPAAAVRRRALDAASAAYGATHGHPLEQELPVRYRWGTSTRAAAVGALAVLLLTALVVGRSLASVPPRIVTAPAVTPAVAPSPPATGAGTPAGTGKPATGPTATAAGGSATAAGGSATSAAGPLVVHVVGRVHQPGVVTLPAGSRVVDALSAAGGATEGADLAALNLARPVVDGEQVHVPAPGEALATPPAVTVPGGTGPVAGTSPTGGVREEVRLVDVNRAAAAELEDLPGIGPVLAERVVEHRTLHGAFTTVEDLAAVPGIGPAVLSGLRERVSVG